MAEAQFFCTQCGNGLIESARYCTRCGKPVGGTPPPAPVLLAPPKHSLHRLISQKKIAGVCAGFAEYFDTDVTLMRIIFLALLVLPPGVGLIGYLIAWVAMPSERMPDATM